MENPGQGKPAAENPGQSAISESGGRSIPGSGCPFPPRSSGSADRCDGGGCHAPRKSASGWAKTRFEPVAGAPHEARDHQQRGAEVPGAHEGTAVDHAGIARGQRETHQVEADGGRRRADPIDTPACEQPAAARQGGGQQHGGEADVDVPDDVEAELDAEDAVQQAPQILLHQWIGAGGDARRDPAQIGGLHHGHRAEGDAGDRTEDATQPRGDARALALHPAIQPKEGDHEQRPEGKVQQSVDRRWQVDQGPQRVDQCGEQSAGGARAEDSGIQGVGMGKRGHGIFRERPKLGRRLRAGGYARHQDGSHCAGSRRFGENAGQSAISEKAGGKSLSGPCSRFEPLRPSGRLPAREGAGAARGD